MISSKLGLSSVHMNFVQIIDMSRYDAGYSNPRNHNKANFC